MTVLSKMSTTKKVVLGSLLVLGLVGGTAAAMMSGHHGGITNHLSNKLNKQSTTADQTSHLQLEKSNIQSENLASHRGADFSQDSDMQMQVSHQAALSSFDQRQILAILAKTQMNSSPMLIKTAAFTQEASPATMLLKVNGGNHGQGHDNGDDDNGKKKHGQGKKHDNDNDKNHGNEHNDTNV